MSIPGGWTIHDSITAEDMSVFDAAMKGIVGVDYEPIAVATQVVNGTNYCFICKTKVVVPVATAGMAKVIIYKPLQGDPIIISIEKII